MKRLLIGLGLIGLFSCESKPTYSHDTIEQSRMQAKENALQNAQKYIADNQHLTKYSIYSRGDSTITNKCPQGDGWASLDLRTKNGVVREKIKCSTTSLALGCMETTDFKSKTNYYSQEGKCNDQIPHPLPKLTN